ncbi:MAG: hypothetical protein ACKO14_09740 [Armatimonadota bacterium]
MLPSLRICSVIAVVATLGVSLVGCAKPSPVGKWTGTVSGMTGSTIEFTADNKVKQTATSPMGAVDAEGTYKLNGDKLDISITSVKMGGKDMMAMLPAQVKSNLNQSLTWAIKEGNLELTGNGGPTTLTPVK